MRAGMMALIGAATFLTGAPRASAQAQVVSLTGTSTVTVLDPGMWWFTEDIVHMRGLVSFMVHELDYGADGTVDRTLYSLTNQSGNIHASTISGPFMAFVDFYGALGPDGLPDPDSYLTTVRVTPFRRLVSTEPPGWVMEVNLVMRLPSSEILKWKETVRFGPAFEQEFSYELVGYSLMPSRK